MLVKRDRNDTVTVFPILVPAKLQRAEGFAAFPGEGRDIRPARTFRSNDLTDLPKAMTGNEAKHFHAVVLLSRALGKNPDALAVKKAIQLLSEIRSQKIKSDEFPFPAFPEPEDPEAERMSFAQAMTILDAVPPERSVKVLFGGKASPNLRWLFLYEVSKALQEAKFVLWWNGEDFKPGLWCEQTKVAFYAYALSGMLRICPHCSEAFCPERPDQNYCSVEHREAHRVARWRSKQKMRGIKNRRNDGTHKTR
ncbi:MAG TPA: hypothetical protein VI636_18925 [Candidatus Angelobacter sp.]